MKQKLHMTDQIISKLRQAEALLAKGMKVPEACRGWESPTRPTTSGRKTTAGCH